METFLFHLSLPACFMLRKKAGTVNPKKKPKLPEEFLHYLFINTGIDTELLERNNWPGFLSNERNTTW
jgi:hypothetical protein